MLEKGHDGKLKRIEYRGKYLRASRTGGVALRAQTKAAGINLTANSKHGLRASTRLAKGTQVAFQNGRFVLRGRYGSGPTKLNLSKSGVSISTKTNVGAINWFKPRYSSAKIGGIQVRGKNALYLHAIIAVIQLLVYGSLLLFQALVLFVQVSYWLAVNGLRLAKRLWSLRYRSKILAAESKWLSALNLHDEEWLKEGLELVFLQLGQGAVWDSKALTNSEVQNELAVLLAASRLPQSLSFEILFGCLAECYENKAGDEACLQLFLDLDSVAVATGSRNLLQERLLAAYAGCCGIDLEEKK